MRSFILLFAVAFLVSGCAIHQVNPMDENSGPARLSTLNAPPETPSYQPGSLWSTQTAGSLFEDTRARRVGDLVMVRVEETATGTKKATTSTNRSSTLSTGLKTFFAAPVAGKNIDVGTDNKYDGTGSTTRSGQLTALVAVSVVEVLPNGNMVIQGSREIQVNSETQIIQLSGVVRPVDISTDNIVLSSRIADARIAYTGLGVIDEKQRPGWFTRLFDYVTPF